MMEDIAFSDWPGQPVDLSGSNPWLPAYGFQPPSSYLEREDFLGNPDADLFLNGCGGQQYMYLETIQEETSDDLRSESDKSESRASPVGWLATDSESGSVIRVNALNELDCESDREIACPAKRRRQDTNFLIVSDDESNQSLSRSSSLLQFESLEKQCQDIYSSSPSIFSNFSFDSLENQRKTGLSPDSIEEAQSDIEPESDYYKTLLVDIPRSKRNHSCNNITHLSGSDYSDSGDSEDTLEPSAYNSSLSIENLKTWRSFDNLNTGHRKSFKDKISTENLSEDSGYSDHLCNYMKYKSSSIPNLANNIQYEKQNSKPAKRRRFKNGVNYKNDVRYDVHYEERKSDAGFTAYDGDVFQNFKSNFGHSYQDLRVFNTYDVVCEHKSPLIERFMRNGVAKRQTINRGLMATLQADALNLEKTSECVLSSKYSFASASEPNLPQAGSDVASEEIESFLLEEHRNQKSCSKQSYFENSACVSSVPKDLNLASDLKCNNNIWNFSSDSTSIAAKNWDLADLSAKSQHCDDSFVIRDVARIVISVSEKNIYKECVNIVCAINDQVVKGISTDMASFKREGSYLEAMGNLVDLSDDENNPCYKEGTPSSTLIEFDKQILKAISETSIQSFHDSNKALDLLFASKPAMQQNRNVISTPNLTILKNEPDFMQNILNDELRNSTHDVPRKSSLINRSTSSSGVSDSDDKTLTYTKSFSGSSSSKGVHFCPVVSEVNWRDDSESTDRGSSYTLSSSPEREQTLRETSPPTPPLIKPQPIMPKRISASQPELQNVRSSSEISSTNDSNFTFIPLKPREECSSQPEIGEFKRRGSQVMLREKDGGLVQAYVDSDGVTYKHTHLDNVYHERPTTNATPSHVSPNIVGERKSMQSVPVMDQPIEHPQQKPPRSGKLGGFFSRIASFRFKTRKNSEDKTKYKKKPCADNAKKVSLAPSSQQRIATKEDYIFIPLKGPIENEKQCNNNRPAKVQPDDRLKSDRVGCISGKPPLPKMPPRIVGASVKKHVETSARTGAPERQTIDSGDELPRPMEPMGLIETDLDTEVTVITSGAHVKTRSLMNLGAEAPPRSLAAPPHPTRPHKSMEFLLDKQNLKVVEPPENELQKGERVMSEHQLRVQRSLQKLTVPDWYKQSQVPREGFLLKKNSPRESRWTGTSSKTTSLSSLGSNSQSPVVLSPTPQSQPFVRWSTSKLNSTASSPCASTRSSFNTRQPNGSISPSSVRSSFSYRQPYLGWRSQERLTRPRTPAERLASSILTRAPPQESPEIQTSIKEVTSAIVHYVSGLRPDTAYDNQDSNSQHSYSVSPRGSQKLCWLESSFVGTRPLDSPQTPVTLSESQTPAPPSSLRLDLQAHNDVTLLNTGGTTSKPSPGSTTLEDVLDSLLGLPSSTRAPSPSLQETASANTSPSRLGNQSRAAEQFRRRSEGSEPTNCQNSESRRVSFHSSPVLRCRYSRCGRIASASSSEGLAFKSCHNCSYTYCSRACRRAHWEKHRKNCLFSRVGSLCRQVIAAAKEQPNTLLHLSQIARRGYLSHGPGAVKCFFSCPEAAENFLSCGLDSLGEPTYIRWPDLLPSEMGPQLYSELVKMCKCYNPDSKLILYVSVCVVSEVPSSGAVKWERQLVSRCAKMRLSKNIPIPEKDIENPETLILTCAPLTGTIEQRQQSREISANNIQRHLRQRGVSLRRQYPDIYKQLCYYTDGTTEKFVPVTVYPKDSNTGKSFMCVIMPEAERESLRQVTTVGVRVRTVDILQN